MKKKMIALVLVSILTFSCGTSKPSWERKDTTQVTQNDRTVLGLLFSGMVIFTLYTFTTK
jgi:hypothetical protein